jgi:hypothetical protein
MSERCQRFKGLILVGEKRSQMAQDKGWSWEQCQQGQPRLCAIKLFGSLSQCGYDPTVQIFLNVFHDDGRLNQPIVTMLRNISIRGYTVIGMGNIVQEVLSTNGIEHKKLVHPAARGDWKKPGRYEAHVAQVLG